MQLHGYLPRRPRLNDVRIVMRAPAICISTLLIAGLVGCSSTAQPGQVGTGGKSGTGGNVPSGGVTGLGGAAGSGGTTTTGSGSGGATGGATTPRGSGGNADGAAGAGGSSGGNGGTGSGGSGGARSTGGVVATGGGTPLGGSTGGASGGTTTASGTGGASSAKGGSSGSGGDAAGGTSGGIDGGASASVACYGYPGVTQSPLYTVTVNGVTAPVEKFTKYSPEMQVHYAHCSVQGTANVSVAVSESVSSYTLSPKSRNITSTKNGNTITFSSGPNYLILAPSGKELLFIFLDPPETDAPKLGDANVKNLADYTVDNTGGTLVTSKIQSAINAASGATQNILYVPPGRYKVGELWLKSNMTLYLAGGAILYGSSSTSDFNTGSGGVNIEGMQHALIRMNQVKNAKLLGRGAIDGNGHAIRAAGLNASVLKIDQSSDITVDGIVSRDSSYWNTLIYRSDAVTIQNYKLINCRPNSGYNNTDGVDFDETTNSKLYNAFLYTGDDGMATKNEEASGTINTKNITHEKIVVYNNSGGCKVGTKTMGQTMDSIVFKDIDLVKAGRGLVIDGADTAVVQNTTYQDVRIEAADSSLVDVQNNSLPSWRTAAGQTVIKETFFTNVSADVRKAINLHGMSSSINITGVHFSNFKIQGTAITQSNLSTNSYVSGITFQ